MTIANFILPLFLINDIGYEIRNDTIFVRAHFYPEEKTIYNSVNNKLRALEKHLEKKTGKDLVFPNAKTIVEECGLGCIQPCNDYFFFLYPKSHKKPMPKPTPKPTPKPAPKIPEKIEIKIPDSLKVKVDLDTLVLKVPDVLPESIIVRHEIAADSTLLKYLEELKRQVKSETVFVAPTVPTIPTVPDSNKAEEGFFEIDNIKGNSFYIGTFYRKDNQELLVFPLGFDFKTQGKIRFDCALDLLILNLINSSNELTNNGLVDCRAGIYNKNLGGGLDFVADSSRAFYSGIYGKGALSLGKPVVYGIVGVNFNLNGNNDNKYRHYVISGITYEAGSRKFMFNLEGKSSHDLLQDKYLNSAKLDLGFGDKTRLLVGIGGKTELDMETIGDATFKEFMQKTELSGSIGAEWHLDEKSSLYIKASTSGKWNEDREYKTVQQGVETGVKFYFK